MTQAEEIVYWEGWMRGEIEIRSLVEGESIMTKD